MFKKRDNEHNWSEWDLRWDHKKGRVWTRRCLDRGCSFIEKSTKVKKLNLPLRLGIPFDEEMIKIGKWDMEVQCIYFNCVADILDRLGASKEQISAIGEQYWQEKQRKDKK